MGNWLKMKFASYEIDCDECKKKIKNEWYYIMYNKKICCDCYNE